MLEDFLPLVAKPARYINHEINAVRKDLSKVKTRICLFFPDTYEVGMAHLGLRILYHVLNGRNDTACERVFSPWTDYEARLRATGRPLTSLESNLPLDRFDFIGITLQYELSYSNILVGLELARIPFRSSDRGSGHPVIVAGGPCAVNPGPLSDFIDVFFIGEAEEAVHELIDLKQEYGDRHLFLEAVSKREGFFVPALGTTPVRRRYLKELDSAPFPNRPLLPLLKPVHDRVTVEVARGCIRGCRFCQAGIIYRPFRERSPEQVKNLLAESLACTGYEELSLASLSSGDHSAIQPLIVELMKTYREERVSVSLPSLRVGTLTPEMIEAIAGTRKTGFTLAPEAGTERLRRVINKPVSDLDLMDAAETIFKSGWNGLKLYFMIGLPTETDEDLDGITRLGSNLLSLGKRVSRRHVQINISVSTFVPKPHTPFQWMGQVPLTEIRRRHAYLRQGLGRRGINLKLHDPQTSVLEGAFARGDRSLGRVLEEAAARGCRFDGWSESFSYETWQEAFEKCGLNPEACAGRSFGLEDALPWDHVRTGVTKEFLKTEYRRALTAEVTDNCRAECRHCGIGCADGGSPLFGKAAGSGPETGRPSDQHPRVLRAGPMTSRVRMKFTKTGRVRFLSHLDLITLFQRAAARARIPVAFSQGFNPHPRISFGPALSVGLESEAEYLDLDTDAGIDPADMAKNLNETLPEGITVKASCIVSRSTPSLSGGIGRYVYRVAVPETHTGDIDARVAAFLSRSSVSILRDKGSVDIRQGIEDIVVTQPNNDTSLIITLRDFELIKPRVQDVVRLLLNIGVDETSLLAIRRTEMFCKNRDAWVTPLDV